MMKLQKKSQPINILYDANLLCRFDSKDSGRSGIFWVTYNVLKYLSQYNVRLYLYGNNQTKLKKTKRFFLKEIPNLYLFDGNMKKMDIYFSSYMAIPEKIHQTGIKCFTILYDIIPLRLPSYFDTQVMWFHQLCTTLNKKDQYFAISEYTKKDFLKFFPQLKSENITVIPLSTNLPYHPLQEKELSQKLREKYHIPADKKYIFSLCTLEPRKNLIRSVKTFLDFIQKNKVEDMVYVLGGGAWKGFIEKFEREVPDYSKYKDKIIPAGYVDDADLNALYAHAEWFVYTSQYEGFGMPPLEAMASGCPVITSNNTSLPEVVGEAGIMIDWDSDEQHVQAYEKYYFDKAYRDEMAQKGLERSKLFRWEKASEIMMKKFLECDYNRAHVSCKITEEVFREKRYHLFSFIPLLKLKQGLYNTFYFVFGILPILKLQRKKKKRRK